MSAYRNWHVGMKVVCVNAKPHLLWRKGDDVLVHNAVYTVRKIGRDSRINMRVAGEVEVWLEEVGRRFDFGFGVRRFRPVQHRTTDISLFKAMLSDTKTKVPA